MKKLLLPLLLLCLSFLSLASSTAQDPAGAAAPQRVVEIRGDRRHTDAGKLTSLWLYPEDYEGQTIKLLGFIFEAENFEYFPEQNGYLFSCEPVIYGRNNAFHAHVGNATLLSREKLNFFCSTAEGQRLRRLFKQHTDEWAVAADVVLEVKKRDGMYFGEIVSFSPTYLPE